MKLFVAGLSYSTTEETLKGEFGKHGEVKSAKIITDRETGRSRGFGFVEFSTTDEADAARTELDGTELDGRRIKVDVAKEPERRPNQNNFRGGQRPQGRSGGDRKGYDRRAY